MYPLLNTRQSSDQSLPPVNSLEPDRQLQLALQPRSMALVLRQALDLPPLHHGSEKLTRCRILDMKYRPAESCTILYQLDEHMLIGLFQWAKTGYKRTPNAQMIEPLGMQVYRFEQDPALPGLATALNSKLLAELLTEHYAGNVRVLRCQVAPLRYRPGKRCTLRLELGLRDTRNGVVRSATLFGKLYHDRAKAQSVYEEMQLLSSALPREGSKIMLASAAVFLPQLALVLQVPVAGTPLDLLLSHPERTRLAVKSRIAEGVRCAAAALAALHQMEPASQRERPVGVELIKLKARAVQVATVDATLGERLDELITAILGSMHQLSAWKAESSLVHGDCKPNQFLVGPSHAALLDFDHCGIADPASDVGTFLATLRQMKVAAQWQIQITHGQRQKFSADHSLAPWCHELEQRFLEEYMNARGCHAELRLRATWYVAVALLRKALRSFARSPRSPLPVLLVEEAWRCLAHL